MRRCFLSFGFRRIVHPVGRECRIRGSGMAPARSRGMPIMPDEFSPARGRISRCGSHLGPCGPTVCAMSAKTWPKPFAQGGKPQQRDVVSTEKRAAGGGTAMAFQYLPPQHWSASWEPCWEGKIGRQVPNSVFRSARDRASLRQAAVMAGLQAEPWSWPKLGESM